MIDDPKVAREAWRRYHADLAKFRLPGDKIEMSWEMFTELIGLLKDE